MRVDNESYKCTVHDKWRDCSAMDYMIHNLDNHTEIILNNKNYFNKVKGEVPTNKSLYQIIRRINRIFSHAMLYHEEVFLEFEREMFLYHRFFAFSGEFGFLKTDEMIKPFI